MKLSQREKGRRVTKKNWPMDEWVRILFMGDRTMVVVDQAGKEGVMFYERSDDDFVLLPLDDSDMNHVDLK